MTGGFHWYWIQALSLSIQQKEKLALKIFQDEGRHRPYLQNMTTRTAARGEVKAYVYAAYNWYHGLSPGP